MEGKPTKKEHLRLATVWPGILCLCLLFCSADCTNAAAAAFQLWWESVLPALFPFYICMSLLLQENVPEMLGRFLKRLSGWLGLDSLALPCWLLGAAAGYPSGARLTAELGLPNEGPFCNLCSPMFLCAVIGIGMLGDIAAALPIAVAHYGSGLLLLLCYPRPAQRMRTAVEQESNQKKGLIPIVSDGIAVMLQIGGCICIFFVASELLKQIGVYAVLESICRAIGLPAGLISAMLQGMLELTSGCAAVAALKLPFKLSVALCAFLVSFGGLCVFLQTRLFLCGDVRRYFFVKFVHGILAAGIAFLCAPIAPLREQPVIAQQGGEYFINALAGGSVFFASCVAVFGIYLMAVVMSAWIAKRQK